MHAWCTRHRGKSKINVAALSCLTAQLPKNTEKNKSRTLLKGFAVLGFFALLGIGEIVFWMLGIANPNNPKAWIALIGGVVFLCVFVFLLVVVVYSLLAKRKQEFPDHTLSDSPITFDWQAFETLHAKLTGQISALPKTGSEIDEDLVSKLRETAGTLNEVKEQLKRMSGRRQYVKDLEELYTRVNGELMSLLDLLSRSQTMGEWLRTRHSSFQGAFRKAVNEAIDLTRMLDKSVMDARTKPKKTRTLLR